MGGDFDGLSQCINMGFYGFILGIFAGRFIGLISSVIITLIILYFLQPQVYTWDTLYTTQHFLISKINVIWERFITKS